MAIIYDDRAGIEAGTTPLPAIATISEESGQYWFDVFDADRRLYSSVRSADSAEIRTEVVADVVARSEADPVPVAEELMIIFEDETVFETEA